MAEVGLAGEQRPLTEAEKWFVDPMNALHDIRHVVAGYGQEPLGELCLLGFRHAQARHPGIAFLALAWGLKLAREQRGQPVLAALREGYRRGKAAVWMDDLDWEAMMLEPLLAVRARLGLAPPAIYDRICHAGASLTRGTA